MARLLFLGASVSQRPAIRYARGHGHFVVACDGNRDAVAFADCDVDEAVDFTDVDRVVEVARRHQVDAVLAVCTDRAVVPAALVAERCGLAGLDPVVARAMTDKSIMRSVLGRAGVAQPKYAVLLRDCDLNVAQSVPLPAVLKPVDSGGQRGVHLIERRGELAQALPKALSASRSGTAIFEEYVEGTEVNTLFAVRDGVPTLLTISDRLRPRGVGFGVGWIHRFPSSISAASALRVEATAASAIKALGMRDGIAFPQLLVTTDAVVVVEVAARIAAGQMADLVRHGTGIELFEIAIRQATGQAVPDDLVPADAIRPVAIRFLTASPGVLPVGTVSAIEGVEEMRSAEGVVDAGLYFGPGATIGPLQVDADRSGYVIAHGETADEALDRANNAAKRLRVRVEGGVDSPRQRSRALPRWLTPALVTFLLIGTAALFVLTEQAKLQHALIRATRVDKTFAPLCRCRQDVARIAFTLVRRSRIAVSVLDSSGQIVDTLMRPRAREPRTILLVWNGRGSNGSVLPAGVYFPDVTFPSLHRSLRLPSPIDLDVTAPRIERYVARALAHGIAVTYRFSEPAHAELYADGRRAVVTRFAPTDGLLRWSGRFASGGRLGAGTGHFALIAVDLAGNRSRAATFTLAGPR